MERERTTTKGLQDRRIISNPQAIPAVVYTNRSPYSYRSTCSNTVFIMERADQCSVILSVFSYKKPGCTLQKFISFLPISLYLHCALHDRSSQNNICCTLNLREKSVNEQFTGKESHKILSK